MNQRPTPRTLSVSDGPEVGRAVPGAREAFPWSAVSRATGGDRVDGNRIALQFEGSTTFDRWIEAISRAKHFVHFENYIIRDDPVGQAFRDALVAKAREGVPVHLLYDWLGCWATPRRFFRPLREAGVQVRAFNRPKLSNPLGVMQRDHRKLVCVDGETAFVGGFCIGIEWQGHGDSPPWRDTGVEVNGPAAARLAQSFERIWEKAGGKVSEELLVDAEAVEAAGDTPIWVLQGEPRRSRMYRTLQLIAAHAQHRLWITDPYFVAPPPVAESLAEAARAGVDVRILVPAHNNWPVVGSASRAGYRFLIESGVRLFEWQGQMIHAKTSVADGIWCRVGSSNVNNASLLGNWEIDVAAADESLAAQLEGLFLADLASSVEIVLPKEHRRVTALLSGETPTPVSPLEPEGSLPERLERELRSYRSGSTGWRVADLLRAGSSFGDALAGHRPLGREDRTVLGTVAMFTLPVAVVGIFFPWLLGWIATVILLWLGGTSAIRSWVETRRERREKSEPDLSEEEAHSLPGAPKTAPEETDGTK